MKFPVSFNNVIKISVFIVLFLAAESLMAVEPNRQIQNRNTPQVSSPRRSRSGRRVQGLYKARVTPHWFVLKTSDNAEQMCFWYRNDLSGNTKEFILVNAEKGTRRKAFDHVKLAEALSKATDEKYTAGQLPFDYIEFTDNGSAILFVTAEKTWKCDLSTYDVLPSEVTLNLPEENNESRFGWRGWQGQRRGRFSNDQDHPIASPDGRWNAYIKDNNVYVREGENGEEIQLSSDGEENNSYTRMEWAPDSESIIAWCLEAGDHKEVYLIESSPPGGGRALFHSRPYDLPGDKLDAYELNIFHIADHNQIKPELERVDLGSPHPRWNKDGFNFTYEKVDRGHQRFRVIEVNTHDGSSRNIIDEKIKTFIWTAHTENLDLSRVNYLYETDEIIYVSEMDGWRHLYLIDAGTGKIKNKITDGPWLVRGVQNIDEENRQIWFSAGSFYPEQDPYFIHYFRVNFDGTGLVALTEANGNHSIQYSPDKRYIIDTYSRVDIAPVHELRRTSDGNLVFEFERADISELIAEGWKAPEVFVAKGRDGETDIWGIISRPNDLDINKKYPVIEDIYAGPQGSFTPKSFSPYNRYKALNDLGFIVVKMDGMGTANRSKAFHDVCWKNLKDAGLPDRILWHKAVAKKYPYYDIDRVGVYGNSAGGQNAAGAVLFYPEFYKVAVASCGCHDNRMDKASWNEQWMGYPVGPQYSECSNIDNAYRLKGKLFLIVGEMDDNVPPESTMRFVDALIKEGKDFDLLVVPGGRHGMGGEYGQRRMHDFFVRNLLNIEP
jgi:dipeptidyl aminopeptidase/acylaminoacyl peptidase